ncbi:MAG: restriction endonuclease subunit S [Candidatus Omnitrophota bacterium]
MISILQNATIESLLSETITGEWGIMSTGETGVKVIRTTNFTNEGKLNLDNVAIRDIPQDIINRKKLRYEDIILEKSGGSDNFSVGRVIYFDLKPKEEYLCNNFTQILRIDSKKAYSKYVFYYLFYQHKIGVVKNFQNKTTGIRNLQTKRYLAQKIPTPSIDVQRKIASILDKCESARAKRKEASRLTDEFLRSVFFDMFGDPVGNTRQWAVDKVKNICSAESGGTPSTKKKKYWEKGKIPWLGSTCCKNNFVRESKSYITKEGLENSSAKIFKKKTVIVALVGATIGKTGFLEFDSTTNQNIAGLYPLKDDRIIPEYLFFTIQFLYPHFLALSRSGFKMANLAFIRNLSIPLPPKEIQKKFAGIVQKVEQLKQKQRESERELNNLFNSLMQKAFKGELVG